MGEADIQNITTSHLIRPHHTEAHFTTTEPRVFGLQRSIPYFTTSHHNVPHQTKPGRNTPHITQHLTTPHHSSPQHTTRPPALTPGITTFLEQGRGDRLARLLEVRGARTPPGPKPAAKQPMRSHPGAGRKGRGVSPRETKKKERERVGYYPTLLRFPGKSIEQNLWPGQTMS